MEQEENFNFVDKNLIAISAHSNMCQVLSILKVMQNLSERVSSALREFIQIYANYVKYSFSCLLTFHVLLQCKRLLEKLSFDYL